MCIAVWGHICVLLSFNSYGELQNRTEDWDKSLTEAPSLNCCASVGRIATRRKFWQNLIRLALPRYWPSLSTFRTQFNEVLTEARPGFRHVSNKNVIDVYFIVTWHVTAIIFTVCKISFFLTYSRVLQFCCNFSFDSEVNTMILAWRILWTHFL